MLTARRSLRLSYWTIAGYVVMAVTLWRWAVMPRELMSFPDTPVSHNGGQCLVYCSSPISSRWADQWSFLREARHAVMPGSSYTVRAESADDEFTLLLFSYALCSRRTPLPTTYFGQPRPEGAKAHYVIAYRDFTGGEQGLRFVVRFAGGAVYERVGAGR